MPVNLTEQILKNFPDPILALNNSFIVEYANAAFEQMSSISLNLIIEKKIHETDLGHRENWNNLIKKLEIFANKEVENFDEISINDPLDPKTSSGYNKNTHTLLLNEKVYFVEFFKTLDSNKSNLLTAIRFREQTQDEKLSDQMIQTEKMSGLGTLAAGFAHEFNNPLYSIIGLSEMIISAQDKEKINSISQRIIDNSKKMASIIEHLAVYSKTNTVKDYEIVNINERLDAALELSLLAGYSKNITLDKDYCSRAFVRARPEEIEQIFFNIFSNSIQAIKDKGTINISTSRVDNEKLEILINDTGEGVQEEFIAKVFDPFFTTKGQSQGSGLGLTTAYQLIKKYEGTINFNSVEGEGSTILIEWPIEGGF